MKSKLMIISAVMLFAAVHLPAQTFYVYDAMHYQDKPASLVEDKISPVKLIYEAFLIGEDKELDMAKIDARIEEIKASGVNTISTDIEEWYSSRTGEEMKAGFTTLFNRFKDAVPECNVGNYGVPVADLNVLRYTPSMDGKSEEEIISRWKSNSKNRFAVADVSDVLYPSLYAMNPDMDQFVRDLETTAEFIRKKFPGKKIIGYIWPQYYNLKTNPYYQQFISPEDWRIILDACYENLDGVVIWAHGRDEDNTTRVKWTDKRVQAIYAATKKFIADHYDAIEVDLAEKR